MFHGKIRAFVSDSRGLSESDWSRTHAKVYLPSDAGGYELVQVKIETGDYLKGTGIIDDVPRRSSAFKLGMRIAYEGGTASGIKPKFTRRLHRATAAPQLIAGVEQALVEAMQFNPGKNQPRRQPRVNGLR